jgi:hypothetical protein
MTIQSSPFVTIKQAAAALGVDKEAIEQRLESGRLQGKKERILSKDVWFIYKSELDILMSKRHERLFGDDVFETVTVEQFHQSDFQPPSLQELELEIAEPTLHQQYHLSLRLMSEEFSRCMQSSLDHIAILRGELREAAGKLLLITDMERRATEDRQLIDDKDAALTKAHERIASLQAEVERLSRPWWKKLLG